MKELFNHMADEHGLTLTESELREIVLIVNNHKREFPNVILLLEFEKTGFDLISEKHIRQEFNAAIDLLKGDGNV